MNENNFNSRKKLLCDEFDNYTATQIVGETSDGSDLAIAAVFQYIASQSQQSNSSPSAAYLDQKLSEMRAQLKKEPEHSEKSDEELESLALDELEKNRQGYLDEFVDAIRTAFAPKFAELQKFNGHVKQNSVKQEEGLNLEKARAYAFFQMVGDDNREFSSELFEEAVNFSKERQRTFARILVLLQKLNAQNEIIPVNPTFLSMLHDLYAILDKSFLPAERIITEWLDNLKPENPEKSDMVYAESIEQEFAKKILDGKMSDFDSTEQFFEECVINSDLFLAWQTLQVRLANIKSRPVYFINALLLFEETIRENLEMRFPEREVTDKDVQEAMEKFIENLPAGNKPKLEVSQAKKLYSLSLIENQNDENTQNKEKAAVLGKLKIAATVVFNKLPQEDGLNKNIVKRSWYKNPVNAYFAQDNLYETWKKDSKAPFWKFWVLRGKYTLDIDQAVKMLDQLKSATDMQSMQKRLDALYLVKVTIGKYMEEKNNRGVTPARMDAVKNLQSKINAEIAYINTHLIKEIKSSTDKKEGEEDKQIIERKLNERFVKIVEEIKQEVEKIKSTVEAFDPKKYLPAKSVTDLAGVIEKSLTTVNDSLAGPAPIDFGQLNSNIKKGFVDTMEAFKTQGFFTGSLRSSENKVGRMFEKLKDTSSQIKTVQNNWKSRGK